MPQAYRCRSSDPLLIILRIELPQIRASLGSLPATHLEHRRGTRSRPAAGRNPLPAATSRLRRLGRGPTRPQAQGRTRSHPTASSPEQRPAQPPQADLREGTHRPPGCATARGETALLPAIGGRLRSFRAALANHAAEDAGSPLWWVSGRHHSVFKLGRSVMPRSSRSAKPRSRLSHHSTLTPITAGRGLSVMRGC